MDLKLELFKLFYFEHIDAITKAMRESSAMAHWPMEATRDSAIVIMVGKLLDMPNRNDNTVLMTGLLVLMKECPEVFDMGIKKVQDELSNHYKVYLKAKAAPNN